jgi:hypothetical protein
MQNGRSGLCAAALVFVALLWAGMLIGVSWIATPVKFAAPSLTMPVALDVGRVTFHLFNRIEWGLAVLLLIVTFVNRTRSGLPLLLAAVAAVLVLLQTIWLLPALDERVAVVIAGGTPPASSLHLWYIIIEAVKLVLLLAVGLIGLFRPPAAAP